MSEQTYRYDLTIRRRGCVYRLSNEGTDHDGRRMAMAIIEFLKSLREEHGWDEDECGYAFRHIRSALEAAASRDNALTVRAEITVPELA